MQNRIIKFRAWDKKNERMVYEPYHFEVYHYSDENRVNRQTHVFYEDWRDLEDGRQHECELMQYTGLKDKNGKEIYEFDIVKAWIDFGPGGEHLETFPVTSSPFGVNIQEWNYKENRLPEVIGNIYEHSHLLK